MEALTPPITRHLSHETWRGLRIENYRYKVVIPEEIRGSEWAWGHCSHWSTHEGAEPLVSLHDAATNINALVEALKGFNLTAKQIVGATATTLTITVPISVVQQAVAAISQAEGGE